MIKINRINQHSVNKALNFFVKKEVGEFTEKDLELHKKFRNPETYPEYFSDFEDMGLDFVETKLMDASELKAANQGDFKVQNYRSGANPKHTKINESLEKEGYDLRERSIQVVLGSNGQVEYMFNGNTMDSLLSDKGFTNRIVSTFKKNQYFNIDNLIQVACRMNNLEHEAGINDIEGIKYCLERMQKNGSFNIKEITELSNSIKEKINFMSNQKLDLESAAVNNVVNGLVNSSTGTEWVASVSGKGVHAKIIKQLQITYGQNYFVDSPPSVKYGVLSTYAEKVFSHVTTVMDNCGETYEYFAKGATYQLIIHMGCPNASDPIASFFHEYLTFWKQYNRIFNCCKPTGMDWVNIRGAYQQVKALDCVWPMYSIVPFEEIKDFYDENYNEKKKKVIIPEEYTKNIPNNENIFDDLLIGIDKELVS
jgi:hypothetical protein